jgi:aspartyl-tRNA(Asn)/glutamyl-tRNA(Gln) amidotransferase subunit C
MKIERREIEQIARLARLDLSEGEVAAMADDLASILDHIQALEAAGTESVSPVAGMSEHAAPMRDDTPGADALHLPLSEMAPSFEENFFTVPRLEALDADALPGGGAA